MSVLDKILMTFFGNKSQRDLKEVQPILEQIKAEYQKVISLSNDELRNLSATVRTQIRSIIADDQQQIETLKKQAEMSEDISVTNKLFKEVDHLEKGILEKIESKLIEKLPVVFAIVKETARRFKENEEVVVTANDFDRDLAAKVNNVIIEGDKAIWKNRWIAGGNEITWDMVHYDVQLIGGIALHQGKIAEMATGEGKTLVATLPVFLNALAGRGVHVVTVNDYLAKRDSEWMGPIYQFHGLSVDCIDKYQPNSAERRRAYNCDITFGTNNEFGFDYLRDNMAISFGDLVQRKHHYAIVDEVDSVLIDDARTPLIISGPVAKGEDQLFDEYNDRVYRLFEKQKKFASQLLAEAKALIAKGDTENGGFILLRAFKALPKSKPLIKFLSEQGNKQLLQKTEDFYMQENNRNMHLVTDELYFVIDEKQKSVELTDKGIDSLTASSEDPNFFVIPDMGSRIAELEKDITDPEERLKQKDELLQEFSIKSERIHTISQLLKAYTLFEKDTQYVVIDNQVKIVDEQTGRIMEGRRYSDGLHQAIEAKEHVKVEAATQTFATITLQNYFRMYHKLAGMTGTAETEAGELWNIYKLDVMVIPTNRPVIREDRDDIVYKTKREKYNAVIKEIEGLIKQSRPVLVGTTSVEISELLSRMLTMRGIKHNVLNAKLHQKEADIVAQAGIAGTVTIATNMAGRGTDIKLTNDVKKAGGLAIIGTERHESRRVDRQLRGRSGRQGDPGSSQFFVSLEDDLMRLFGSDRIASLMDRMGLKDGEMIQHSMITKSIERAQKKVEENNFGVRKRLLEYDDVMNSQREVIYTRRRHALDGERISIDIRNMMEDIVAEMIENVKSSKDLEEFKMEALRYFSIDPQGFDAAYIEKTKEEDISVALMQQIESAYIRKSNKICEQAWPVIKNVYENDGDRYVNIIIPVTDGKKVYNVFTNLKKAYETEGREVLRAFEKTAILANIDNYWKEHLRDLDDLKQSVQNASYEQKDPLLIYKFESFNLFKSVIENINKSVISILTKGQIPIREPEEVRAGQERKLDMSRMQTHKSEYSNNRQGSPNDPSRRDTRDNQPTMPIKVEKKVGRNEPCPCGSGKKYKNCHGKEM